MKKQALKKKIRKMELLEDSVLCRYLPAYYQQAKIFACMLSGCDGRLKVLDMACGGGSLSYLIMQLHKQASVVGFDANDAALDTYNRNLAAFCGRVSTIQGVPGQDDFGRGYDIVVASMALGNIEDRLKQPVCRQIYESLNPGGIFLARDFVMGASPSLGQKYFRYWRQEMTANGLEPEIMDEESCPGEHPAPMHVYLERLQAADFADVDCHWRHLNFAIFGGSRPAGAPEPEGLPS